MSSPSYSGMAKKPILVNGSQCRQPSRRTSSYSGCTGRAAAKHNFCFSPRGVWVCFTAIPSPPVITQGPSFYVSRCADVAGRLGVRGPRSTERRKYNPLLPPCSARLRGRVAELIQLEQGIVQPCRCWPVQSVQFPKGPDRNDLQARRTIGPPSGSS